MFITDTFDFAQKLQQSGLNEKTSEAMAKEWKEIQVHLVTKEELKKEIEHIKKDRKKMEDRIMTRIDRVEERLSGEIKLIRSEIKISMLTTIISLGTIIALIQKFIH
jgi:hypothetical protein